jgi:hypothetical protein
MTGISVKTYVLYSKDTFSSIAHHLILKNNGSDYVLPEFDPTLHSCFKDVAPSVVDPDPGSGIWDPVPF